MSEINIPALPAPLTWLNQPQGWNWSLEGTLSITAGARSDWFIDPQGTDRAGNAPALLFETTAPRLVSARVSVDFGAVYDAGALLLYRDEETWAKLCLEQSPQGKPTVVSVVTRAVSDDCNSFTVEGNSAYLRVAWLDRAFAFHYSSDGAVWSLIRYFSLGDIPEVQMGFLAQSPLGDGCAVTFTEIRYEARLLEKIRSGE